MTKAFALGSAILPGMSGKKSAKPRIVMVGAGSLASALAVSLHQAGYVIEQIIARTSGASLQQAKRLASEIGASATALGRDKSAINVNAEIVWFCVPDGAIAGAAQSLATAIDWTGKVALH
jgi:prephenate dehydrogenase